MISRVSNEFAHVMRDRIATGVLIWNLNKTANTVASDFKQKIAGGSASYATTARPHSFMGEFGISFFSNSTRFARNNLSGLFLVRRRLLRSATNSYFSHNLEKVLER
ncbi:MAG: hypothetical protein CMK92_04900 [Pseudomonas sp.]|nr:hypothetical protein [Pseudomonas sp.]